MVQSGNEKKNPLWERITKAFGTEDVNEIAGKLKITYQGVNKWRKGDAEPSRLRFQEMSSLTNSSIDWLMTGKENLTGEERDAQRFSILSNKFGTLSPANRARAEILVDVLEKEIERMEMETEPE